MKRSRVERSLEPGAWVAAIALAAVGAAATPVLLPVTVVAAIDRPASMAPPPPGSPPRTASTGTIETDINGARVRLRGAVDEASLRTVLRALARIT